MVGSHVGQFIKADPSNFNGQYRDYMRVRVLLDVRKPLKPGMKLKKPGGAWVWVRFLYEKLLSFCFACGIIGHNGRFCEKILSGAVKMEERLFGSWLRAPSKKQIQQMTVGEKWLCAKRTI